MMNNFHISLLTVNDSKTVKPSNVHQIRKTETEDEKHYIKHISALEIVGPLEFSWKDKFRMLN